MFLLRTLLKKLKALDRASGPSKRTESVSSILENLWFITAFRAGIRIPIRINGINRIRIQPVLDPQHWYLIMLLLLNQHFTSNVENRPRRIQYSYLHKPDYQTPVPEFIDPDLGMKNSIFMKNSSKRSFSNQFVPRDTSISMLWTRSDWGVVFKYWNCVEEEIS
jgi:hypothetical protein